MFDIPRAPIPAPDSGAFGEHSVGVLELVFVEIGEELHDERILASLVNAWSSVPAGPAASAIPCCRPGSPAGADTTRCDSSGGPRSVRL